MDKTTTILEYIKEIGINMSIYAIENDAHGIEKLLLKLK